MNQRAGLVSFLMFVLGASSGANSSAEVTYISQVREAHASAGNPWGDSSDAVAAPDFNPFDATAEATEFGHAASHIVSAISGSSVTVSGAFQLSYSTVMGVGHAAGDVFLAVGFQVAEQAVFELAGSVPQSPYGFARRVRIIGTDIDLNGPGSGFFVSGVLPPGQYTLEVDVDTYKDIVANQDFADFVVTLTFPSCEVAVPGDYSTIQQAIDSVPERTTCLIVLAPGVHAGPIDFLGKDVVVRGAGAEQTAIHGTGGEQVSVVRFSGGEPATAALEGVTVEGGRTGTPFPTNPSALVGGGLFSYNSAASIRDCIIEDNVGDFGGGAYLWNSTGTVANCIFRNNQAGQDGGGLQVYGGTPVVSDTLVENNSAGNRGGGLHLVAGMIELLRTTVRNNASGNVVGGVSWSPVGVGSAYLTMDTCTVTGNTASVAQGGFAAQPDGPVAKASLASTEVCGNIPPPNVSGPWTDLGGNTVCECVGDIVVDGAVNGADLGILLSQWGTVARGSAADLNNDGDVNGADLGLLLGSWGPCQN